MSIIGSNILAGAAGSGVSAYEIEQSLRFDGNSYLDSPFTTANSTATWSVWCKRVNTSGEDTILYNNVSSGNHWGFRFGGGGDVTMFKTASGSDSSTTTDGKYRDPSAWYHLVMVSNGSSNTIWINGVSVKTGSFTWPFANATQRIGYRSSSDSWNGYLAEFHYIDGTAVSDPDGVFGEYDDNGVWRPIEYTGSHGSNGYYLKFDPTATNGIGHDHSGNGNNFTASGFTTSGTGTDVMSDTPTNNFCTFNPLDKDTSTPTNGNLNQPMPGRCAGTIAVNSGKWYWEAQYNAGNGYALGIGVADVDAYYPSEGFSNGIIYYGSTGTDADAGIYNFGTTDFTYDGAWSGGRIGIALDLDSATKTITFYRDGTNKGAVTIPSGKHGKYLTPIVQGGSGSTSGSWDLRMQSDLWTDSAPTGHKELCTANLPAPEIADGSEYFNTVLYTGTGTTNARTDVGFQPDFVWIKERSGTNASSAWHALFDAVRGNTKALYSNETNAESTGTAFSSFDSSGFTLGLDTTQARANDSGDTYVAWNWLAGNGTSTNTNGSEDSTVSVSASSGFSIVNFTGTGSALTVGHGLGVAPDLMIAKSRDQADNWVVWHNTFDMDEYVFLEANYAKATTSNPATFWNNTAPTSTVVSIGANSNTNVSGNDTILYCFAEVEGFSKIGSYTGNGNLDGVFKHCGFKPAWLLVRRTNTAANWHLLDSTRSTYNLANTILLPDVPDEESTYSNGGVDLLSNGFKIRSTGQAFNNSGDSYIFVAFAENPFGGSGVSPATAR